ncbi:tyrosine-type recombinase/integrase [Methanococcoides sp. FTZ1]|uniref:tyrosine-type recombinase/integrase n=1 Tax=Methanococcoides sp. FTZ1 TaxID=3439061 RepID=UPI003F84CCA9
MTPEEKLANNFERLKTLGKETISDDGKTIPPITSSSNVEISIKYVNHLIRRNRVAKSTIHNIISDLILLFSHNDIELDSISEEDIDNFLTFLQTHTYKRGGKVKPLSEATKMTRKAHLRDLLKFLDKPELVDMIEIKPLKNSRKLPEDLLTKDEVQKLIDHANSTRDKALIASLYDSGARIGEQVSCKIKNIQFDDNGCVVIFPEGKTGARRNRLVYAASYLRQWIDCHPQKDNPDAPLWISLDKSQKGITTDTVRKALSKIAERAGVKKRVNPHSFRHARATHLAPHMTEQQMKSYLGWTPDSNMAGVYVHLSGKDTDDAVLAMYGMKNVEEQDDAMAIVRCPRCKEINPKTSKLCGKCLYELSEDARKEKEDVMMMLMDALAEDDRFREIFLQLKASA